MSRWADMLGVLFGVAIVYVLVRPQSKAGDFVEAFADFVSALARSATDLAA
jgi:hypothetical protein